MIVKMDGNPHDYHATVKRVSIKSGTILYVCHDITEHKRAESLIQTALMEKDVLMREIHHRVKNNMQIVISLLKLQAKYIDNKQIVEKFTETQNRVKAMALIHDRLYMTADFSRFDYAKYINDLINDLLKNYNVNTPDVSVKTDVEDIGLGIETAIHLGLIINELISNSLKYAFPDSRAGEIKVSFHKISELRSESQNPKTKNEKAEYELIVSDNGVGLPDDLDIRKIETLGLLLVINLAESQLLGTLELDRSKGTEFRIRFRV